MLSLIPHLLPIAALSWLLLPVNTSAAQPGTRFLVGGALRPDNQPIHEAFIRDAGGPDQARIAIFTTSSWPYDWDLEKEGRESADSRYNSRTNGEYYSKILTQRYDAAEAVWIPLDCANPGVAHDPGWVERMNSFTGFYFAGGDQSRYVAVLFDHDGENRSPTPMLQAIRQRVARGAAVLGSSAGTAVQVSADMITSGDPFVGLIQGGIRETSGEDYYRGFLDPDFSNPVHPELEWDPAGGLGLFHGGLLDTHFAERGRQGRLIYLAAVSSKPFAFGIDENTAMVVRNHGQASSFYEVIGQSGVHVFDSSQAELSGALTPVITNMVYHYLRPGDRFFPGRKDPVELGPSTETGLEIQPLEPIDIFSSIQNADGDPVYPRQFIRLAQQAVATADQPQTALSSEIRPFPYRVTFTRTNQTQARLTHGQISFKNLMVDLTPVSPIP